MTGPSKQVVRGTALDLRTGHLGSISGRVIDKVDRSHLPPLLNGKFMPTSSGFMRINENKDKSHSSLQTVKHDMDASTYLTAYETYTFGQNRGAKTPCTVRSASR